MIIVGILNILMSTFGWGLRVSGNPTAPRLALLIGGDVIGIALVLLGVLS